MTTEEAKEFLRTQGYYADFLWSIADVQTSFDCTDTEAMAVLDVALNTDWVSEQVFSSILDEAFDRGYTERNY